MTPAILGIPIPQIAAQAKRRQACEEVEHTLVVVLRMPPDEVRRRLTAMCATYPGSPEDACYVAKQRALYGHPADNVFSVI